MNEPMKTRRPLAAAALAALLLGGLSVAGAAEGTATLQIANTGDDYKESADGTSVRGDRDHDLWSGPDLKQAFRFPAFPVPAGASVLEARLEVYAGDTRNAASPLDGAAAGEAAGNAAAWTGTAFEITNAPKTAASVAIRDLPAWTAGTHNPVADVAPIVQEIVRRPDYAQGNAVKVFLLGGSTASWRSTRTYDGSPSQAARLVLRYSTAPPPPPPAPPVAAISASPSGGAAPLAVGFDGSGSSDADGAIVQYRWSFGDGSADVVTAGPTAGHTYGTPGDYTATLTVTDDDGLTGSASVAVSVTAPGGAVWVDLAAKGHDFANPASAGIDVPDDTEATVGAYLHFNCDNDNGSAGGTTKYPGGDHLETGPVAGEDDLKRLSATLLPSTLSTGRLVLRRSNAYVQVWSSAQKGAAAAILAGSSYSGNTEGNGRRTWDLAIPAQRDAFQAIRAGLWVEGRALGTSTVTLTYEANGAAVASDAVKYSLIGATTGKQPNLEERVRWGAAYHLLVHGEWSKLAEESFSYNCAAWSVGITNQWLWENLDDLYGDRDGRLEVSDFDAFYWAKGYAPTPNLDEAAIVLYFKDGFPNHAARKQTTTGAAPAWRMFSSKMGDWERVEHVLEQLNGTTTFYECGAPGRFYKKR